MIGKFIDALPRRAQQRIAHASGRWVAEDYHDPATHCRCLAGHAGNFRLDRRGIVLGGLLDDDALERGGASAGGLWKAERRFDALCFRFGTDRVGGLCEARARRRLAA
ncbi:hypothetical protein [Longimicrobium sp.]|uniref:hypothetical protein n=1 Tax=Longimicrobium sp. TaxID=2029185 RepID=UPI002F959A3A